MSDGRDFIPTYETSPVKAPNTAWFACTRSEEANNRIVAML